MADDAGAAGAAAAAAVVNPVVFFDLALGGAWEDPNLSAAYLRLGTVLSA